MSRSALISRGASCRPTSRQSKTLLEARSASFVRQTLPTASGQKRVVGSKTSRQDRDEQLGKIRFDPNYTIIAHTRENRLVTSHKPRWFTCTPVRFTGDERFFARDSGLLCKGFQEIGVHCKAIMPGPAMSNDQSEDLIRTDFTNLEDASWWKSLGGNGVVLYAWGLGKYRRVASAIKQSGMSLVSHLDSAGMLGPVSGNRDFLASAWELSSGRCGSSSTGLLQFVTTIAYHYSIGVIRNDFGRAAHLKHADLIGAIKQTH